MGRFRCHLASYTARCLIVILASGVLLGAFAGCGTAPQVSLKPTPTATVVPTATLPPTANLAKVQLGLDKFATGLVRPDYLTSAHDGSGRVYILEQAGRIRVADASGKLYSQPFLNVETQWFGELGLMGLAFHPKFKSNGLFFISYTALNGDTLIARYSIDDGNPLLADSGSAQILLHITEPHSVEHRSGMLAFGPDGYLYIGVGDGGLGAPSANGQRKDTVLGKVLRIDVDHTSPGKLYAIPADNPFVGDASAAPEIWAYGVRNPWRFGFDRTTGNLFIGDVGESTAEEIDFQPATSKGGVNYGWNMYEGTACVRSGCSLSNYSGPIAVYPHNAGRCAIIGGYVYRAKRYPSLQGIYLFGDLCSGRIYGLNAAEAVPGKSATYRELLDTSAYLSSFGEDETGNVYMIDLHGGTIYRVTAQ
jgi:glucose/arabinose dehydrogenase